MKHLIPALLAIMVLAHGVECSLLGGLFSTVSQTVSGALNSLNSVLSPVLSSLGSGPATTTVPPTMAPDISPIGEPLTCGLSKRTQSSSGNDVSQNGDWPWMAVILNQTNFAYICAGAVANRWYIVTTALCMRERTRADQSFVRVGDYDLKNPSPGAVAINLSQVILHEAFDPNTLRNDIALLRLASPVPATFPAVCFPAPDPSYDYRNATMTGWGVQTTSPYVSRDAVVTVWNNTECMQSYAQLTGGQYIFNSSLCTNFSPCGYNYGEPVVLQETTSRQWRLIGLFSWALKGCSVEALPPVHTRITFYLDWIGARISDNPITPV